MAYEYNEEWVPQTRLGKLVFDGQVTSMDEAMDSGLPIRESKIVDLLLPELEDEVLDINMVQRMTDSGRRVKFRATVIVGNGDGFVGLGQAKDVQVGPAIRKAIDNAKINITRIKRGCGSWECGCGLPHTVPSEVNGKAGSVTVVLKPAPRGLGLAASSVDTASFMLVSLTVSSIQITYNISLTLACLRCIYHPGTHVGRSA